MREHLEKARQRVLAAIHDAGDCIRRIDGREVAINLGIVLATVLLLIGAVEGALHLGVITGWQKELPAAHEWCEGPENRNRSHRFHPDYGWTEHPGHVYLARQRGEPTWDFHAYNQEGFRDLYNTGNDTVIVLGDSFTRGVLADNNATFPYLLDRWTPDVAFHSYGMSGYSTAQSLTVYRNVSDRIDHELVILAYYLGNDAHDNVARDIPERPWFDVVNGSLKLVHPPSQTSNISTNSPSRGIFDYPLVDDAQAFLRNHSLAYRYVEPRAHLVLGKLGVIDYPRYPLEEPPTGPELEHQLTVTKELLRAVADKTATNDAHFLIVTIPERSEANPDRPARYDLEIGKPYWDAQRDVIDEVTENRSHVDWLDVTPALEDRVEAGDRVYGQVNPHLDERGYLTLARQILDWTEARSITDVPPDIDYSATVEESSPSCPEEKLDNLTV